MDKEYVLRINGDAITEDRLASIDRLAERYREMGLLTSKLYKTVAGKYISKHNQYGCYISEYIDLPSLEEKEDKLDLDAAKRNRGAALLQISATARHEQDTKCLRMASRNTGNCSGVFFITLR